MSAERDTRSSEERASSAARGELFILSAPSGTGKTTLIRNILAGGPLGHVANLYFAISHTTRKARASEVDGRDYRFVDPPTFQTMIAEDRFLEWAEVHGNYYGTALEEVLPRIEAGIDVLMDIDVQGAERVLSRYGDGPAPPVATDVHSIFLMPPSYRALEERLGQRRLDDPQEISRRLAVSRWEIRRAGGYDYVIVNRDVRDASRILASIILEKRYRRERMAGEIQAVLDDFSKQAASYDASEPVGSSEVDHDGSGVPAPAGSKR